MSLVFVGPGGSAEQRWIFYALLRDNVRHHLEKPGEPLAFPSIHQMSEALRSGNVRLPAGALRAELEAAEVLRARPIADLAVSARTFALLALRPPGSPEETRLASAWPVEVPMAEGAKTLDDVFGSLLSELLRVVGGGGGGEVEVIDQ